MTRRGRNPRHKPPGYHRLAAGLAVMTVMWAGCGSSDDDTSGETEETTVDNETGPTTEGEREVPDELIDRALERLGSDRESLQIDEPMLLAPSECRLVFAWDIEELDGPGLPFVLLADGSVADGIEITLEEIVESCYFASGTGDPEPGPMADLVMAFGEAPSALVVAGPAFASGFDALGVEYADPAITTADGVSTLVFLAYDPELDDFYRVHAVRSADGSLAIEYERLV